MAFDLAGSGYGPEGHSAWLDIDWREHLRWVVAEGCPVNLAEYGEGPPILFVHGLGGCWQNWLEQLPELGRDHRVLAPDLPGFGASPEPEEDISISGYGRLLVALLDEVGIETATVVGNSMGGFIAAEMAVQAPERVEQLVLVSAAGISQENLLRRPVLAGARMFQLGGALVAGRAEELTRRPRARKLLAGGIIEHPDRLPAALVAEQTKAAGKPGFMDALEDLLSYRIRDRLSEISVPTLIVWGRKDRIVPRRDADEFEQLIGGARKVVLDDTGHVPQLERPCAFNALLREFLGER